MATETFALTPKASISLSLQAHQPVAVRARTAAARAAGITAAEVDMDGPTGERAAAIVEAADPAAVADRLPGSAEVTLLSENLLSVRADLRTLTGLGRAAGVRRVNTKKLAQPHLDAVLPDVGLPAVGLGVGAAPRPVAEDGTGVLVCIIDSGFDLSHPMFRDPAGQLRVERLLDQTGPVPREFSTAQLQRGWADGSGPGSDESGHGTHVATIAAGSRFGALEGVAPGARLLLVKTNFRDTDLAVRWAFDTAGTRPCVINMSLGHHFGSHDGTEVEERLHAQLTGPGRIIVISAGNERADDLHIGGRFHTGAVEEVPFDLQRLPDGSAFVVLTLWHAAADDFTSSLVLPSGEVLDGALDGTAVRHTLGAATVELARAGYPFNDLVQHQIGVTVGSAAGNAQLRGWRLRLRCTRAVLGRLDGWFQNSGFATFREHPLVETARTVGLSATGAGCLAVASHVTRSAWTSDSGPMSDARLVAGRSSPFSSQGPARDGRQKPDLSAPGQMVTAALARGSGMADDDRFVDTAGNVLTIAGTSMSAPVVTGAVAMLLQQKPDRTLADVSDLLRRSVRRDGHTGPAPWDPTYGWGKLDVVAALRL